jgi:hypothetical protein
MSLLTEKETVYTVHAHFLNSAGERDRKQYMVIGKDDFDQLRNVFNETETYYSYTQRERPKGV